MRGGGERGGGRAGGCTGYGAARRPRDKIRRNQNGVDDVDDAIGCDVVGRGDESTIYPPSSSIVRESHTLMVIQSGQSSYNVRCERETARRGKESVLRVCKRERASERETERARAREKKREKKERARAREKKRK